MSDIEQQRRALRQEWPERSVSGGGQIPNLTPEQYALAQDKNAWLLADEIHHLDASWFTRHGLHLTPSQMNIVQRGCGLGIFKKSAAKEYWRKTPITRAWVLTALALRDEWIKSPEAQAIRDAIIWTFSLADGIPPPAETRTNQSKDSQ